MTLNERGISIEYGFYLLAQTLHFRQLSIYANEKFQIYIISYLCTNVIHGQS